MGDGSGSSLQVALEDGAPPDVAEPGLSEPDLTEPEHDRHSTELDAGRRRFTWAALIAMAVTAVPFIWILWSDWGPVNPQRKSDYENNFYELQARAMFHGHLSLANGALGIEGFVHDGKTYTYFGLFPSIIRMPILLVTSSLDGQLTTWSMLAAWLLTGLFASLLLWRVRYLVRGDTVMGRAEAGAFGILLATLMGGTIWMLLASIPFVFNEDIAWSICLTVGSIFALLGVVERPSWGRVIAAGVLIMCTNLDRATTGWACAVGAGLIAVWFFLGFGGRENRRWFVPILAVGVIPVVIACIVNYAKFGSLFGVSNQLQVWTHVNAYRRKFLAANHGAEEGLVFTPTNLATYFRPGGLSISGVFPYLTLPTTPPTALGGVLFDRLYRTSSLPASTPLLFLLSIWGLVTAFRPKAIGQVARTRLLLLASGSAGAALMLWGYIAPRYLGDFVPFLVLASAVAMADIVRRLQARRLLVRNVGLAVIAALAAFSIAANIGMAIVPNEEWTSAQMISFVDAQNTASNLTGHPLATKVERGSSLPDWGPAGQLYVIGNCNGLYESNGEDYATVPSQQYQRTTWMTVQLGPAFQHTIRLTVNTPASGESQVLPLANLGGGKLEVTATPSGGQTRLTFGVHGGSAAIRGGSLDVGPGTTHTIVITADPAKHQFNVAIDGTSELFTTLNSGQSVQIDAAHTGPALVARQVATAQPTLCQSLVR